MSDYQKLGWVRLYRKIEDNFLWFSEPFTKAQAWIDLFLNANHQDSKISIRGNTVTIKRGQLGWSEITMGKRWKWSKNKVRRFLKLLETEQQIIQQKDRYITTIITIINYEEHQSDSKTIQQTIQQKDSRRYINKNDKNDNNIADKSASPLKYITEYFHKEVIKKTGSKPELRKKDFGLLAEHLKTNTAENTKKLISWYLTTEKFRDYPTLSACLSSHTVNLFNLNSQSDWQSK